MGTAEDLERQARLLPVRARGEAPPIRFDRVEDAHARILGGDLLDQQLRRRRLAAAGLAEHRGVLLECRLRNFHLILT
jgi:hypothetical protein